MAVPIPHSKHAGYTFTEQKRRSGDTTRAELIKQEKTFLRVSFGDGSHAHRQKQQYRILKTQASTRCRLLRKKAPPLAMAGLQS